MFGRPAKTTYPQGGLQVTEYAKRRFKWIFLVQGGDKFTKVWSRGGSDLSYFGVNKSPVTAPLGHRYSVNDTVGDSTGAASTFAELPLSELPADITFLTHAARYGDISSNHIAVLASTVNNSTSNYCFINLGNGYAPTKNAAFIENGGSVTIGASTIYDAATGRKLVVGSSAIASKQDVFFSASFKNVSGNTFRLHGMGRFAFPHGMQLMAIADSAIVGEELERVTKDPYGMLFEAPSKSLWTPAAVSVTLPTLVQPNATTTPGAWTPTGAASLHDAINELIASDTQYISVNSASTTELVLAESAYPGAANQTLAYRASSTQGSTLTVTLKQGVTTIMTRTHSLTGVDTLYTQTLTAPEIALITSGAISVTLTTS